MRKLSAFFLVPFMALALSSCVGAPPWQEQHTVYFEFGSAKLSSEAKARLDNIAGWLANERSIGAVTIVGFADRIGSHEANERLSQRRAEAVKAYLQKRGYRYANIGETQWVGERHSTAACGETQNRSTIECLSPDRKVEVWYIAARSDYCSHNNRHCRQDGR